MISHFGILFNSRTGRTNDGDVVLRGFELPEGNIDSDTTLTLGLQLVKHPCILERTFAKFGSFLRKGLAIIIDRNGEINKKRLDGHGVIATECIHDPNQWI